MCAALFGLMAVLDDRLAFAGLVAATASLASRARKPADQEAIEVSVRRGLDARQALDRSDRSGQLLRIARGAAGAARARMQSAAPGRPACGSAGSR
jgi:hypothetical protein